MIKRVPEHVILKEGSIYVSDVTVSVGVGGVYRTSDLTQAICGDLIRFAWISWLVFSVFFFALGGFLRVRNDGPIFTYVEGSLAIDIYWAIGGFLLLIGGISLLVQVLNPRWVLLLDIKDRGQEHTIKRRKKSEIDRVASAINLAIKEAEGRKGSTFVEKLIGTQNNFHDNKIEQLNLGGENTFTQNINSPEKDEKDH